MISTGTDIECAEGAPPRLELPILYQDDTLIAVHKPAGLLVHKSWIASDATEFALQTVRDQIGQYVYPVHRLDRPTSGLLLFAKSQAAAKHLSLQFESHSIDKSYLAIVRGWVDDSGTIDHPLKPKADKIVDRKRSQAPVAQQAITQYQRLATCELDVEVDRYPRSRYSLVKLHPHTGRKHQLRRHLKHIAHPIIGDPKHGKSVHNNFFKQQFDCGRLLLAAVSLTLKHPDDESSLHIACPLAEDFYQLCVQLGWESALSKYNNA